MACSVTAACAAINSQDLGIYCCSYSSAETDWLTTCPHDRLERVHEHDLFDFKWPVSSIVYKQKYML